MVASITQCKALYEYTKRVYGMRKKWQECANKAGWDSFNLMSTMDVCDEILKWLDKISYSYHIERTINSAFNSLGQEAGILKTYFERGYPAVRVAYPSERTGRRRLSKLADRVLMYCDADIIQTVLEETHINTNGFYTNFGNRKYRV